MKAQFRITYRHEITIEAETSEEAQLIWQGLDLGKLDKAVADGEIHSHDYVESVSFEDEENNDVS